MDNFTKNFTIFLKCVLKNVDDILKILNLYRKEVKPIFRKMLLTYTKNIE